MLNKHQPKFMNKQIQLSAFGRNISLPVSVLIGVALVIIWTLTPISDYVTNYIVEQIPVSRDVELGMAGIKSERYKEVHDSYGVKQLGEGLIRQLPADQRSQYRFQFRVIDSKDVNAWAYPGGFIYITTSLIRQMKLSKEEIAAVLSHEIGHVISRHSQKEIIKENVLSWLVSGFLRDDRDGHRESFGENVHEMLVENAPKLSLLAFSRADEYEADSRGVALMLAAGHSPQGMISFFDKLLRMERREGGATVNLVERFMSTHPATEERIQALRDKYGSGRPASAA